LEQYRAMIDALTSAPPTQPLATAVPA